MAHLGVPPVHWLLLRPQVLIESRQGPVRNVLNAQELVDDCNRLSASWPLDPASPIKRIQCRWAGMAMGCAAVSMEGSGHARQSQLHAQCILVRCECEAESTAWMHSLERRTLSSLAGSSALEATQCRTCWQPPAQTCWWLCTARAAPTGSSWRPAPPCWKSGARQQALSTGQGLVPAPAACAGICTVSQRLPALPACCGSSAPAFLHLHCPQALPVWLSRLGGRLLPLHQRQQQPDPLLLRPEHRGG